MKLTPSIGMTLVALLDANILVSFPKFLVNTCIYVHLTLRVSRVVLLLCSWLLLLEIFTCF
jgi:hypothetical protein